MDAEGARQLLDGVFEEQALVIGGLIATHAVEDLFVRRLFRSFGAIRVKALAGLRGEQAGTAERDPNPARQKPHPAIEEFLGRLGSD